MPGSGTFGMEAVARQFATGRQALVIRNGWFSYRWTQIFDMGQIPSAHTVLKARPVAPGRQAAYAPAPIDDVVAAIRAQRPGVVFAPHVETAAGILLPDAYLRAVADAVHEVGGLFVLDCIASGAIWVDMQATGVDVLVSAPQKGWSGSPCCAFVMLSERARVAIDATTSTTFAADLKKWLQIMETYEGGAHAYHTTLPTDALTRTRDVMLETRRTASSACATSNSNSAARCARCWWPMACAAWPPRASRRRASSSATPMTTAFTRPRLSSVKACRRRPGVPLMCDEPADFKTFRIGLFGLDKLHHADRSVANLETALVRILGAGAAQRAAA